MRPKLASESTGSTITLSRTWAERIKTFLRGFDPRGKATKA